jgi:nitrate/nitrite-specific signal transduction histidine kinase
VNDDGVGLPRRRRGQGMGLHIMQSRAVAIDGKLTVRRRPGGGTAVTCTMKDLRREGARPSP